ncbi:TerC family protein [Aquabacter spiritensis]|uniref:YjbE family integral membrane protein n=1 Tax=Aquabacter spiritensis TaxID=933073 RepID=A0A4R3LS46_9HYPH|nr:TerC family protein [Aquabacter spiritensis]TCT03270.1 YjbE family integral membrane protein [Aquabacter spiritensis]
MSFDSPALWFALLQIIWINILLSGDNAVVIAMACRSLPDKARKWGIVMGAGVAVALRILFTGIVATLLALPWLKLVGSLALMWIAVDLALPGEEADDAVEASDNLWKAVGTVAVADIVMSLDNVVAVAAVANGNWLLLVLGLAISIPLIVAGSSLVMSLLDRFPLLVWAGAALLGWVAGEMLVSDVAVIERLGGEEAAHHLDLPVAAICALLVIGVAYGVGRVRKAKHSKA